MSSAARLSEFGQFAGELLDRVGETGAFFLHGEREGSGIKGGRGGFRPCARGHGGGHRQWRPQFAETPSPDSG